ncbi:MAG: quinone oxidoreductase [Hyphomicrobium sp.]|nr:quinone oxidoreductase [Hyphomicrobium sp.]ODT28367.1 MAG: quinone oxidoreductase [Hyphomicrobium sp. SCN 65-11]
MAYAIRVHKYGGPEAMSYEAVDVGAPGAGQVKLKQHAIGVNFIDVYQRTGLYPQPSMPFTPGNEGAGEVTAVGEGVTDLKVGDRVAYAGAIGAYADERLAPADKLVKLPDAIPYETGAAMMLQGMTVQYLLRRTYKVGPETTLLMHAAAGGIGLIACQWAKHLGATIIGTASSDEKCALAKAAGATHMINYKTENFVERVNQITGGKKCDVVYDSIGKDTFPASLDCLKPLGLFVTFGNASGPIDAFNAGILAAKGSLYMTRPTLNTYTATRADLVATAKDLFDVVASGAVKINVNHKFALKDAAQAHKDLEGRKTTGSIILLP